MRNIKKLLALMLVMVMALGMVPMVALSAPADFNVDDFIDADSIDERYVEAVDVLAALSVYIGEGAVGSRSFNPTDTFTRGQAAAIMARIILGSTTASRLPLIDTGYSDVPAGHWAAGYVGFGKDREIILGYGDGTFGVDDPVTALQMARLLLRAIGYGTEGELEGPGWEVRTVERATARDVRVLWGTGEIDFSAPATREQVAQYTFNALTNTRTVTWNTILNTYTTWSTGIFAPTDDRDRLPTLGMKTFGLDSREPVDDYGFATRIWHVGNRDITVAYQADVTLGEFTAVHGVHTMGWMASNYSWWNEEIMLYVNGQRFNNSETAVNHTEPLGSAARWEASDFASRGSIDMPLHPKFTSGMRFYLVDSWKSETGGFDGQVDKVIIVYEHLGRVTNVNNNTGVLTYTRFNATDVSLAQTVVVDDPGDFVRDDFILVTLKNSDITTPIPTQAIQVVKADVQTVPVSSYTTTPRPTITVGGNQHEISATAMNLTTAATTAPGVGNGTSGYNRSFTSALFSGSITVVFDSFDNIIGWGLPRVNSGTLNYLYVMSEQHTAGDLSNTSSSRVRVMFTDGTTRVLNLPISATAPANFHVWDGNQGDATLARKSIPRSSLNATATSLTQSVLSGKWFSYTLGGADSDIVNLTTLRMQNAQSYYNTINVADSIVDDYTGDAGLVQPVNGTGTLTVTSTNKASIVVTGGDIAGTYTATSGTIFSDFRNGTLRTYTGFSAFPAQTYNFAAGTIAAASSNATNMGTQGLFVRSNGNETANAISHIYRLSEGSPSPTFGIIINVPDHTSADGVKYEILRSDGTIGEYTQALPAFFEGDIVSLEPIASGGTRIALAEGQKTGDLTSADAGYLKIASDDMRYYADDPIFFHKQTKTYGDDVRPMGMTPGITVNVTYVTATTNNVIVAVVINSESVTP